MAEYIVSARKYRPVKFNEMVGQEQVATTLKNAIRTNHLAHSFLFCGPRGVGKTTAARILAKTINCESITADFEPCGICNSCTAFQQNASFNIHELDAASNNSVDDIRALVDQVRFPPQSGKYKIYIIDEVHMLSQGAFNAFLKTLEEPPAYCKFILATTEKHKILPTILSRCQIFDFKRIGIDTIVKHLRHICEVEHIDAEEDALHIIAQKADGGMRDALSIFDRLSSFAGGKLSYAGVLENLNVLDYDYFFKVTDALLIENLAGVLQLFDEILRKGFEGDDFILGLCEHFRNLLFCKDERTLQMLEVSENLKQRYGAQSSLATPDFLINCLNLGNQADVQYKVSRNKRLTIELALVKMCYVNAVVNNNEPSKKKLASADNKEKKDDLPANQDEQIEVASATIAAAPPKEDKLKAPVEPKIQPEQKPQIGSKQQVSLSKTKKILKLDSLDEIDKAEENTSSDAVIEERFDVEVLTVNAENIAALWEDYASSIPEEKRGLRINFATFKPQLDETIGNRIFLKVQSDIQKAQFEEVKPGLQNFFSKKTGANILFEIFADKEISTGTKPYTPKEKFERLVQKNPAIRKMQQQLGLELDYE